jgi:histidyl-tRNA synthetase
MAIQKPSIPKGTRDFGPAEMARRNYLFDVIRSVFKHHGYLPIETPAMENLDTLLGKYGEEGDKLLFKILNSGDYLGAVGRSEWLANNSNSLSLKICEKGLRYDLTVPFARYVVQHQQEIEFPFKRYQIQPVWRADRPQKGRYREFCQCDADVIGSNSLFNEADLIGIVDEVFFKLGVRVKVKLNNRKILAGIAECIGYPDRITDITIAIDKFEKIGLDNVAKELIEKGIDTGAIHELEKILFIEEKESFQKLNHLKAVLKKSETGIKGIEELITLFNYCKQINIHSGIDFDLTLARGLNYYTGAIIEVKALDAEIGSICGGGRYDDLTGIFGLKNISGVGISFGADRIYDVMAHLNLFPDETTLSSRILFVNFGEKEAVHCFAWLAELRDAGIAAELYPDAVKLNKQLSYANARHIQYVVMAGENEIREGMLTVKNMISGVQTQIKPEELLEMVSSIQ